MMRTPSAIRRDLNTRTLYNTRGDGTYTRDHASERLQEDAASFLAVIAEVLDYHRKRGWYDWPGGREAHYECGTCKTAWPCPTVALLQPATLSFPSFAAAGVDTLGPVTPSGLQRATEQQQREATCGAQHPTNPSFIPCMRRAGHPPDYHWSTSGCSGGSFAWHGNSSMFMAAHTVTERPAVGGSDTPADQPARCKFCGKHSNAHFSHPFIPVLADQGEKPPDGSETYLDPGDIPSPLLLDRSKDND